YRRKRLQEFVRAREIDRELEARETWTRQEIKRFRTRRVDKLVRHAARHAPFYRDLYGGQVSDEPVALEPLPVIDKTLVLEHFDRIVTDPRLKVREIQAHLQGLTSDAHYLGSFHALATAGSSGTMG